MLHHIVSRVVIGCEGIINLELRAPFSYLQDIGNWIRDSSDAEEIQDYSKTKTSSSLAAGFVRTECSLTVLSCGKDWITFEHLSPLETTQFLDSLPFPQRESLAPFITNPN
jgi:hypothetical protein